VVTRISAIDGPSHPEGDCRVNGSLERKAAVDAVCDIISEVASVPAVEKIPNPLSAPAGGNGNRREGDGPGCLGIRKATCCAEETPGFVGGRNGLDGHLRCFRFGETTNALSDPHIQSNRRDCSTFCILTPGR
jgi:hypothetical protein